MSRPADPISTLSLHHIDALVSLQNREARGETMRLIRALASPPAPISSDWIRSLFQLETKLFRIVQNDKKWFFNHLGDPDAQMFARDINLLHSIAANSLAALVARRDEWSTSDNTDQLQNAVGLQMYHYGASIKWSSFQREPINPAVWPRLHQLYEFAEQHALDDKSIVLFQADGSTDTVTNGTTTVVSLYIRALLLDALNTGNLNVPQIEIADGWLAEWTTQYQLVSQATAESIFYIDLTATKGLTRKLGAGTNTSNSKPENCRYLQVSQIASHIKMVRDRLRIGVMYQGRGFANSFAIDEHVALLSVFERLAPSVTNEAVQTIEPRSAAHQSQVNVITGLSAIYQTLSGSSDASHSSGGFNGFTLTLEPLNSGFSAIETKAEQSSTVGWALSDRSATGMGFIVKASAANWVEPGHLLAIQVVDNAIQKNWTLVSVVRKIEERLHQESRGDIRLGTAIICTEPIAVTLTLNESLMNTANSPAGEPKIFALFLAGDDARGRDDTLLLSTNDANLGDPSSTHTLATQTAKYVVKLNRAQRDGQDWISFRFEVIEIL